jgi:acyl-CoA thioesterase I
MRFSFLSSLSYAPLLLIRNVTCALILLAAPLSAAPVTLLALGDSLTAGYGLPPEDGLVPQLEAWLKTHGTEAKIINAGVSGDTTAGGLARTDWALTPDVQAVMVNLGGNDMLRGIDPASSRANLDGIISKARAKGLPVLLVSLRAPGNYGAQFKRDFDAMYGDLATKYAIPVTENYFFPLIDQQSHLFDPALMQADGIHPNAKGVARAIEVLGPQVQALLAQVK